MQKVNIVDITLPNGQVATYAIIERSEGEFLSMLKTEWDELEAQRKQSGTL